MRNKVIWPFALAIGLLISSVPFVPLRAHHGASESGETKRLMSMKNYRMPSLP